MVEQENRPERGMNIIYLSLEQTVETMSDSEVRETVRQLGSEHRRLIKKTAVMVGLEGRNSVINTLSSLEAESPEHKDTIQRFLNYALLKQEVLFRLRDAARLIDAE